MRNPCEGGRLLNEGNIAMPAVPEVTSCRGLIEWNVRFGAKIREILGVGIGNAYVLSRQGGQRSGTPAFDSCRPAPRHYRQWAERTAVLRRARAQPWLAASITGLLSG